MPDAVSISVKNHFDQHCKKPTDRRRHPDFPGVWLHPKEVRVELNPGDHYSGFFYRHPEVFGSHLGHAYADGWVAIQRWTAYEDVWLVRYATLQPVLPTLRQWASDLVQRNPEEAATPIRSIPALESHRIRGTLKDLAEGKHRIEEDERCLLPPPEDLHQFCREARERQEVSLSPWPDHVDPGDKKFVPLFPSNGDWVGYFNLVRIRQRIQDIEARLARPSGVVGVMHGWGIRVSLHSLRSWLAQIETGEVPECVGDGYLEWLAYLRCRNGIDPQSRGRVL